MPETTIKNYAKDYTEPALRMRLKKAIKAGTQGGKANQWSARKAQLLKQAYESQGGGYKHKQQKTAKQKSLMQWSKEDWQTSDSKSAIKEGKTTRYLPKQVWEQLSPDEKQVTNALKVKGSRQGKQNIKNPQQVRKMLKKVRSEK